MIVLPVPARALRIDMAQPPHARAHAHTPHAARRTPQATRAESKCAFAFLRGLAPAGSQKCATSERCATGRLGLPNRNPPPAMLVTNRAGRVAVGEPQSPGRSRIDVARRATRIAGCAPLRRRALLGACRRQPTQNANARLLSARVACGLWCTRARHSPPLSSRCPLPSTHSPPRMAAWTTTK